MFQILCAAVHSDGDVPDPSRMDHDVPDPNGSAKSVDVGILSSEKLLNCRPRKE